MGMNHMFNEVFEPVSKPFIRVDYKEFKPETYWGVVVSYNGKEEILFSGNFDQDLSDATTKYPDHYMNSSVIQFMEDIKANQAPQ